MKTILLPTDFSPASGKALEFALMIAKKANARIVVAHACFIPTINLEIPTTALEELYDEEKNDSEKELMNICKRISAERSESGQPLSCEFISEFNIPVREIVGLCEKIKPDLLIMGSSATEDVFGLFGSTTNGVINNWNAPVLIVHEHTRAENFRKIYFAVEDVGEHVYEVSQLAALARLFDSEITIIHANHYPKDNKDFKSQSNGITESEVLAEAVQGYAGYDKIKYHHISVDHIAKGLEKFLEENGCNMLALLKHKRTWIEKIFHPSVTKFFLKKDALPLIVLHKID